MVVGWVATMVPYLVMWGRVGRHGSMPGTIGWFVRRGGYGCVPYRVPRLVAKDGSGVERMSFWPPWTCTIPRALVGGGYPATSRESIPFPHLDTNPPYRSWGSSPDHRPGPVVSRQKTVGWSRKSRTGLGSTGQPSTVPFVLLLETKNHFSFLVVVVSVVVVGWLVLPNGYGFGWPEMGWLGCFGGRNQRRGHQSRMLPFAGTGPCGSRAMDKWLKHPFLNRFRGHRGNDGSRRLGQNEPHRTRVASTLAGPIGNTTNDSGRVDTNAIEAYKGVIYQNDDPTRLSSRPTETQESTWSTRIVVVGDDSALSDSIPFQTQCTFWRVPQSLVRVHLLVVMDKESPTDVVFRVVVVPFSMLLILLWVCQQ